MNVSVPEADRRARRRLRNVLRLAIVVAGLALIFVLVVLRSGGRVSHDERGKLRILRSFSVPLREISGLSRAGEYIFAVGDDTPLLGVLQLAAGKLQFMRHIDFTAPLWHNYLLCAQLHNSICRSLAGIITKQWEGLHYEPTTDTIHVLQESTGSIFVFNRAMDRIVRRTQLDFFPEQAEEKNTARRGNSLGEGFLPLSNGQILVAKEKFPAAIIAFGEKDEEAQVVASVRTLHPLHYWHLPPEAGKDCDLSDITRDEQGELYGISQVCQRIYRFARLDRREQQLQIAQSWFIGARVKAPEALVIIAPQVFLVASDVKHTRHNLWLLAAAGYQQQAKVAREGSLPPVSPR